MTLIIAGANTEFSFVVCDRRFTYQNGYFDDEKNKLIFFAVKDARLLVAFTGLAELGTFKTARWLAGALSDAARPDFQLAGCIPRLTTAASAQFRSLQCAPELKRLSIMMVGYWFGDSPPRGGLWLISNFERNGAELPQAQDSFECMYKFEQRPFPTEPHFAIAAGMKTALPRKRLQDLAEMMQARRPPSAAMGKALDMIRSAASSPLSQGKIGMRCNSGYIRRGAPTALVEYHSSALTNQIYMPDSVIANGQMGLIVRGTKIESFDENGESDPLVIPKVGRNTPCPCGSGLRFKRCHGR